MRTIHSPAADYSKCVLPIESGGTGAQTLAQAAQNLHLVTNDMIGQPDGPVPLDSSGKIPLSFMPEELLRTSISLQGNTAIVTGQTVEFQITDYDSFKNYNITASGGTIVQVGDIVQFTAPGSAQDIQVTIGGREFVFEVISPQPARPFISAPVNAASGLSSRITVVASAFQAIGGVFTHLNTDWQVASDSNFATIVYQSLADTANKTTIDLVNLPANQTFYLRCRYRGSDNSVSNYSQSVSFSTRQYYEAMQEEAILIGDQGAGFTQFGTFGLSITEDGKKATAMVYTGGGVYATRTYVFKKVNGVWSIEQTFDNTADYPSNAAGLGFWRASETAKISPDGSTLFLGQAHNVNSNADGGNNFYSDGRIHVYTFNGTSWVSSQVISAHNGGMRQSFGSKITCSTNGEVMFTAAPVSGDQGASPQFFMYRKQTGIWQLVSGTNEGDSSDTIGSIDLTPDGTRFIVTRHVPDVTNNSVNVGKVYNVAANFTFESHLTVPVGASKQRPGRSCSISSDGSTVLIGSGGTATSGAAPDQNALGVATGSVHVFTRSGAVWTHQTRIINDDVTVTEEFGDNVKVNTNGTVFVASASRLNNGATANRGAYYIYRKNGSAWERSSTVRGTTDGAELFSRNMSFNSTLTNAIVSGSAKVSIMS